jgi:hypothetical protein
MTIINTRIEDEPISAIARRSKSQSKRENPA